MARLTKRIGFAVFLIIFLTLAVVSVINIAASQMEYYLARQEYEQLRQQVPTEIFLTTSVPSVIPQTSSTPTYIPLSKLAADTKAETVSEEDTVLKEEAKPFPAAKDLLEINPDYIGWIRIDGTNIDYPVVQGEDNYKYLSESFSGDRNSAGAIFMDKRCAEQFDSPLVIVYGHNMKDGSMFADLNLYLDDGYFAEHQEIVIAAPNGEMRTYKIISARITDINDIVYSLTDAEQKSVLALSTCTNGEDEDERLVLVAAAD